MSIKLRGQKHLVRWGECHGAFFTLLYLFILFYIDIWNSGGSWAPRGHGRRTRLLSDLQVHEEKTNKQTKKQCKSQCK